MIALIPNVHTDARKLLLCLIATVLAGLSIAKAQMPVNQTTPTNVFDDVPAQYEAIFSTLDDGYLSTGLLAERAYPVFPIGYCLGDRPYADSIATSAEDFPMAIAMIRHMGRGNATATSWLSTAYLARTEIVKTRPVLNLGVALFRFDRVLANAGQLGLVRGDTTAKRIYDKFPRSRTPYYTDTALIVTSLSAKLSSRTVSVVLDTRDFMRNLSSAGTWQINLGSGFVAFTPGQALNYTFPTVGTFPITVKVSVGGQTLQAHTRVIVTEAVQAGPPPFPTDSIPIDGGGGSLLVYHTASGYSGGLRDVIIFVGGYDPNNDRAGQAVTLGQLEKFRFDPGSGAYANKTVASLIVEANHDIIFIDWADGGARMQDNGAVVARAIKHINRLKDQYAVCSESVIVGQSMGGLCTKIGISLLEAESYPHRLSKFISWDAPHLGANVPVNLQAASAYILSVTESYGGIIPDDIKPDVERLRLAHASPAARQLKLYHVYAENRPGLLQKEFYFPQTDFLNFQTYYQSLTIRVPHFAISDGSTTDNQLRTEGGTQTVAAGSSIFTADAFGGQAGKYIGAIGDINVRCNFLPGNFTVKGWILAGSGFLPFPIPIRIHNKFEANIPNYDVTPSSTSDNGLAELGNLDVWGIGFKSVGTFRAFSAKLKLQTRYFAFVPTTSSQQLSGPLVRQPVIPTGGGDILVGRASVGESYVNQIKGDGPRPQSVWNHEHVSFTPQLATFFVESFLPVAPDFRAAPGVIKSIITAYNFGQGNRSVGRIESEKSISGQYTIQSGGRIAINAVGRIGKMSEASNPQSLPQPFSVNLMRNACNAIATIDVQTGGRLDVGDQDRAATFSLYQNTAVTLSGGAMTIAAGSTVIVGNASTLTVRAGSTLTVNGLLMVQGTGRIVVENQGALRVVGAGVVQATTGGVVAVNGGATLRLDDAVNAKGLAALRLGLGGKLQVDGAFTHGGNGRVELLDGAVVQANSPFKLTGEGVTRTSVLVVGAPEVRGPGGLDFSGLEAYYNGQATLRVTDPQATVRLNNVKLIGNPSAGQATGIEATSLRTLTVTSTVFELMQEGLRIWGSVVPNSTSTYSISSSQFRSCRSGLIVNSGGAVSVDNSTFDQGGLTGGATAMQVTDAQSVALNYVVAKGFRFPNYAVAPNNAAVRIVGNTTVTIRGGSYENNSYALNFTDAPSVTFSSCTRITGNEYGVYAYGSATRGVVTLSGTLVGWNNTAFSGQDVSLSGSGNDFEHDPNRGGKFMRLWYSQRPLPTGSTPVNLQGNFWSAPVSSRANWNHFQTVGTQTTSNSVTSSSERSKNLCGGFGPQTTPTPVDPAPGRIVKGRNAQHTAYERDIQVPVASEPSTYAPPSAASASPVAESATPSLTLYPNPSPGTATARFDNFKPVVVEVFDAAGRRVYRLASAPGEAWQIEEPLSPGLFKVLAIDADGRQLQQTLVVQ